MTGFLTDEHPNDTSRGPEPSGAQARGEGTPSPEHPSHGRERVESAATSSGDAQEESHRVSSVCGGFEITFR